MRVKIIRIGSSLVDVETLDYMLGVRIGTKITLPKYLVRDGKKAIRLDDIFDITSKYEKQEGMGELKYKGDEG